MRGYKNPALVNKLQVEHQLSAKEATDLFEDTKRFLALCATTPARLAPTRAIDKGWHSFILFTVDYAQFCKQFCGRFIHHVPEDPFSAVKDFEAVPGTARLAAAVFGDLSSNWASSRKSADCSPSGCQGKDCSPGDCTSCKTCSHNVTAMSENISQCCRPCETDPNA